MTEEKTEQPSNVIKMKTDRPLTRQEVAEKAIEEMVTRGINPIDIAAALGEKISNDANIKKKQTNAYNEEMKNIIARVEYKELIAREIEAGRKIDNHNREMQEFETYMKKIITESFQLTLPKEQLAFVEPILKNLELPVEETAKTNKEIIKLDVQDMFDQKMRQFVGMSKKERDELLKEYA